MSNNNDIIIYRMTHIENIPHILENGITHKKSTNSNPSYINIGDLSLIGNRENRIVHIDNGDFSDSNHESIKLGDFTPFYFGIRMPMLYTTQFGGNFVEKPTKPEEIIYIACSVEKIIKTGNKFYFSDGHATNNYSSFYDKNHFGRINEIIDWASIKATYWGGEENLNMKRKKQAEFLVLGDVDVSCIIGYVCYNEEVKLRLRNLGISKEPIKVIPKAYF